MNRLSSIVLITPPKSLPLRLAISAAAVVVLIALPIAGLRLYRGAKAEQIGRLALPNYVGVAERMAAARIVRTERRVEDPNISPLDAGAALVPLLSWRDDDFHLELLRVPFRPEDSLSIARADAGFRRFARAADADILGATIAFPPDSAVREWPPFLPIPTLRRVDGAFERWLARADSQRQAKRFRAADSTLRQAANAAVLLIDDGDFNEALAGMVAAKKVAQGMIALAEASGDSTRAASLRQRLAETDAVPFPAVLVGPEPSMDEVRAVLPELMAREDLPRAFQWAYVLPVVLDLRFRACVALDISAQMAEPWVEASRRRLLRTSTDSVHWDWLTRASRPAECPLGDQSAN
jgi:hypothetical protein